MNVDGDWALGVVNGERWVDDVMEAVGCSLIFVDLGVLQDRGLVGL